MASISEASSSAAASSSPAGPAGSAGSDGSAVKAVLPGKAVTSTASTTTTSNFTSGRSYDSAASAKKLPYSQTQITETVSQRVAKLSAEDFSDDFERLSMEAIPRLKRIFDALALEMPVSAGKKASTEERNEAKNRKSTLMSKPAPATPALLGDQVDGGKHAVPPSVSAPKTVLQTL